MHIKSDRALIPAGTPSTRYLSVTVAAPAGWSGVEAAATPARPGVRVSLVLDRSGSMERRKLALARQAVGHAIRLLNAHDELGVVVYDHDIETVLERMPATPAAKRQALARLGTIEARGTTDLSGGWWAGARSLGAVGAPVDLPPADELPLTFDAHTSAAPAGDPERSGSMPAPRRRRKARAFRACCCSRTVSPTGA